MTFEVDGDDDLILRLAGIRSRALDLRPAWPSVADAFADQEQRVFATQGAYPGPSWAPLDPQYAAWKAANGFSPRILVRTGRLRDSVTVRPLAVEDFHEQYADLGTDVPYARYHQDGTGAMPQRKFVHYTEELSNDVDRILSRYIVDGDLA